MKTKMLTIFTLILILVSLGACSTQRKFEVTTTEEGKTIINFANFTGDEIVELKLGESIIDQISFDVKVTGGELDFDVTNVLFGTETVGYEVENAESKVYMMPIVKGDYVIKLSGEKAKGTITIG